MLHVRTGMMLVIPKQTRQSSLLPSTLSTPLAPQDVDGCPVFCVGQVVGLGFRDLGVKD